jgi:hypothetical protein
MFMFARDCWAAAAAAANDSVTLMMACHNKQHVTESICEVSTKPQVATNHHTIRFLLLVTP